MVVDLVGAALIPICIGVLAMYLAVRNRRTPWGGGNGTLHPLQRVFYGVFSVVIVAVGVGAARQVLGEGG